MRVSWIRTQHEAQQCGRAEPGEQHEASHTRSSQQRGRFQHLFLRRRNVQQDSMPDLSPKHFYLTFIQVTFLRIILEKT